MSHLWTASVKSAVIRGQYMMSLVELVVYWILKCERWALAVISLLIEAGMMILVPRYTILFWVVSSSLQGQYSCTQSGVFNLSSGHPLIISNIKVQSEMSLLVSRWICSRHLFGTKTTSSRLVSSTSLQKLFSWLTWKIRWVWFGITQGKSSSEQSVTYEHLRARLVR